MNVYGLIGFPLEHSFSKKYFLEKFQKENIRETSFELFPLASISEFPKLFTSIPELKGVAVTIPYKIAIIPFLSEITPEARAIGAVNCVEITNGRFIGHNTDAIGFEKSLKPLLAPDHQGALLLGNGGAAQAVKFVLSKLGLPYQIVSRTGSRSDEVISYREVTGEMLRNFPLIINCSPVGMHPLASEKPEIPYDLLGPENLLYDLIYNPEETLFLKEGRQRGCSTKNGFEMLCIQAEENWKIWTAKP